MPLSKQKKIEYMRDYRRTHVIPKVVTPEFEIVAPIRYHVLPNPQIIKIPQIDADGQVMPDYD